MIIIGEKLNSSIPSTLKAMQAKDESAIIALIKAQADVGARFLDINTAICADDEKERMLWVIDLVKKHCSCGIMIDSTDTELLYVAAKAAEGRELIFNSTTITDRFDVVVPLALETGAAVVGLPIDDEGMPHSLSEKCDKLDLLIEKLRRAGLSDERIYVDVLIETLATSGESARISIGAIGYISKEYPQIKTVCGLSNISFGLPNRALINSSFLSAAFMSGLSAAIMDPIAPAMQATFAAAKVIAGEDEYCMDYITYVRSLENE